ncbi:MAG: adenosylcobinamide-GDP ribazoletransferase [Candidatus Omnitrophota bacterium]
MNSFLLALQFLTVIPLRIKDVDERKISRAAGYFPLVGLLLGLILVGINSCLSILHFPGFAAAIILIVSLAVITGGMHLDGLADTADAFLSGKAKDEMLVIMRDPHIGVMGVLSIVAALLIKAALLYSISAPLKIIALLLMCVLSRWGAVLAMSLFPYARKDGKAGVYIRGMNRGILIFALITTLFFSFLIWQFKGVFALLAISGCVYLGAGFSRRKIDGITGDILGAGIELAEVVVLFIVCSAGGLING